MRVSLYEHECTVLYYLGDSRRDWIHFFLEENRNFHN
jgi:hypothetical protein